MSNITYRVGGRGCGKTAWLLDKLDEIVTQDSETNICLLIKNDHEYRDFMEYMYTRTGKIAPVLAVTDGASIPPNSVLLVDNMMRLNIHMEALDRIFSKCKAVYVTLDGELDQSNNKRYKDPWADKFEQLTIDTQGDKHES